MDENIKNLRKSIELKQVIVRDWLKPVPSQKFKY